MKKINFITLLSLLFMGLTTFNTLAQTSSKPMAMPGLNDPWTNNQLLEPSILTENVKAERIKKPLILNIGAVEDIKGAKHIGAVSKAENMKKLRDAVAALPKNTELVIYCGCCPFTKCPNIRPAFIELQKLGFTRVKLLNLPTNLKTNWIAKGYPLASN